MLGNQAQKGLSKKRVSKLFVGILSKRAGIIKLVLKFEVQYTKLKFQIDIVEDALLV